MATTLHLNGTQVSPDNQQSIKLTKENPYFTQSDSYTLEVSLPVDIFENRIFFGNIHRIERSKRVETMKCTLLAGNIPIIDGSARITQITEQSVKIQLLGGNSEINFLSENSDIYIDELNLGKVRQTAGGGVSVGGGVSYGGRDGSRSYDTDNGIRFVPFTVIDETYDTLRSVFCFNLLDMVDEIVSRLGFTITKNDVDRLPWNCLYIATALPTTNAANVLPHWTPKEFFEELSKFFNVTILFDQIRKTVRIVSNTTFFSKTQPVEIEPVEEYKSELTEDNSAHSLSTDNLEFDMSASEHHDYDVIPGKVRELAQTKQFTDTISAINAYNASSDEERSKNIYASPTAKFTAWDREYVDGGEIKQRSEMTQIDVFSPIVRDEQHGQQTEMKICPVAIARTVANNYSLGGSRASYYEYRMPSLENPTGLGTRVVEDETATHHKTYKTEEEAATIQSYITGEYDIEKKEKENRLQLMFVSGMESAVRPWSFNEQDARSMVAFTDFRLKMTDGMSVPSWSLALNPSDAEYYLGQLHQNGFTFNTKAKTCFKFLSRSIPDQTSIFLVHGKRYGCEKLEIQIDSNGISEMMTGYFYEMTD